MSAALRTGRPRGRPPIPYRLESRFTEEQVAFIEAQAALHHIGMSSVIRMCVVEAMQRHQKVTR